ncbi:hypothetical protein H1E46_004849, partial [Salmonella enterica]|nr:hypothetical protein [Salmonella enterica]
MSDTTSPFVFPEKAAHEVVLELIRAGKISYASDASDVLHICLTTTALRGIDLNRKIKLRKRLSHLMSQFLDWLFICSLVIDFHFSTQSR